jgi:secondary thiamine-phosphate synthase enzyme
MIYSQTLEITPGGGFAVQNITHLVNAFVTSTRIQQGQLIAFYKHSTGSIFIGEHEGGIIADLERMLESLAPTDATYHHHLREVDFNGYAHIRAALMPTSLVIPIEEGALVLGTHQEIMVVDSQPEELPRYVFLQASGE